MSLAVAEKALVSLNLPFRRENQGLLLQTVSPRTDNVYIIFISEDEGGKVKLTTKFCPSAHTIERSDKLCNELNKSMEGVALRYSEPQKVFYMNTSIPSGSLVKNVDNFLIACDFVFPVCKQVSQTGEWDDYLAYLARCDIKQIGKA